MEKEKNSTSSVINETLENEILIAKHQFKIRWTELVITIIALAVGVTLFCFGLTDLVTLSIILFGALWNFFTESNKFFACIMAFLMCITYAYVASRLQVYGHAFLHLIFYLPTQLIYYYENQKKDENVILHDKKLSSAGFIGTIVSGWVLASGICFILYEIGDPYYIIDALSTTLLIISVFLANGKYSEYYVARIFACVIATITWVVIAFVKGFERGTTIFVLLFVMYTIMDIIKFVRWNQANKRKTFETE